MIHAAIARHDTHGVSDIVITYAYSTPEERAALTHAFQDAGYTVTRSIMGPQHLVTDCDTASTLVAVLTYSPRKA